MTDHYRSALAKSSASPFLVETHAENTYVEVNNQHFKERQYHNQNTSDKFVYLNTATTVPTSVFDSTGNFVDIYLDNDGKIHKLRDVYLEWTLNNTDDSALTPSQSDFCIERVDVFIGERQLGTTNDISNFLIEKMFMSYDELITAQTRYLIDPSDYSETASTIGAAASRKCSVNITGPLKGTGLFLPGLEHRVKFTVYFRAVSQWAVSADPSVTATNFKVRVVHTTLNKKNYDQELIMYRQMGVRLKYLDARYTKHAVSNTAGTESNQRISNVTGLSAFLLIFSRGSNPTGGNLDNFKVLDNLYITDGATNVVGGSAIPGEDLRFEAHKKVPSRMFNSLAVYPFFFCENPLSTYHDCINTGYFPVSENHIIYWTPAATASDQIEILSLHYNTIYIKGSTIIVDKSQ